MQVRQGILQDQAWEPVLWEFFFFFKLSTTEGLPYSLEVSLRNHLILKHHQSNLKKDHQTDSRLA